MFQIVQLAAISNDPDDLDRWTVVGDILGCLINLLSIPGCDCHMIARLCETPSDLLANSSA